MIKEERLSTKEYGEILSAFNGLSPMEEGDAEMVSLIPPDEAEPMYMANSAWLIVAGDSSEYIQIAHSLVTVEVTDTTIVLHIEPKQTIEGISEQNQINKFLDNNTDFCVYGKTTDEYYGFYACFPIGADSNKNKTDIIFAIEDTCISVGNIEEELAEKNG